MSRHICRAEEASVLTDVTHTESVCPVCLTRIPAKRVYTNGEVRLEKTCKAHGTFSTPVWRERTTSSPQFSTWLRPKTPSSPQQISSKYEHGCPYDCGLCANHRQHTCTALIEITWRCNLRCPVCFASEGETDHPDTDSGNQGDTSPATSAIQKDKQQFIEEPTFEELTRLLQQTLHTSGASNIQFSGGEPTVREDLPELIRHAKQLGFPFVQVNTNGLRFAQEKNYATSLAEAGLDSVFLQFDGLQDSTWKTLRGRSLFQEKKEAIARLKKAGIGIVLVPTVVPHVNDHELGDILRFAISHAPAVRGVHFQPISYFGSYPKAPADTDRITLPEVIDNLSNQSDGMVHNDDFLPPGCEHSLCSFHANYIVREDNSLQRISVPKTSCDCSPIVASEGADKAKRFVRSQWAAPAPQAELKQEPLDALDTFILRAKTHRFAISGMAFQDAWTLDMERLQGCCIHVVAPDGKLVPFCAYNLTSINGRSLHRKKHVHQRKGKQNLTQATEDYKE